MSLETVAIGEDPQDEADPAPPAFSYRMTRVQSEEELRTWRLVRQNVYLEEGLFTADDLGDSVYVDDYDDYSEHFLAWDSGGNPVATARLIFGSPDDGRPLQIEGAFDVSPLPNSAEISGFAVVREHRTGLAQVGLMRALFERLHELGIDHSYAEVEPWFFKALTRFGYPVTRISDSKFVFNAENFVIYMRLEDFWEGARADIAEKKRTLRGTYYAHPWDGTIGRKHLVYHAR